MRNFQFLLILLLPCFWACEQVQEAALLDLSSNVVTGGVTESPSTPSAEIVFQSTDQGQTWQDISSGLPADLSPTSFLVADGELFLTTAKGIYRNSSAATKANWKKEMSLMEPFSNISTGSGNRIAFNREGRFYQKLQGTGVWMPIFTNFENPLVRSVHTTESGIIFIGCDNGLFKSSDQGKSWKHVMENGWVFKMVESDGVLLCTNESGILRSTDGGENWDLVLSEGGVGITVETIKGGFAAITCCENMESRRVRTSMDGGLTWQAIDADLPPSLSISSIQEVGDYFYCGHPNGIYRSDDRGQTWELLQPTIGEKVFELSVSGEVLYAILRDKGC
ncbi:WD40/YVTN/BNR-like repeat-containing protein [Flavilitoribacter nigricans]|uniref:Glycosyl hydrolase n=1 Tax=Flavilitoribacter nigricans (strain ATCC 23147 / DSM 23189 / NBRC 102662 / NCIMB 1420 / SS-2) TaxID=1122177 RepID=A0A2D0N383_FLAN2|nr:glycosyl hydrolase [Flavilitoribacter nigricans]PHN02981.1 glycosyl hydrolase [Flavilitoribacter nigricans DSM 23189 = NBRC 102662]